MQMTQVFLKELEAEASTTRKMLSRIPDSKYDWKPHEKSMTVRALATHIAELASWIPMVLHTSELDFESSPYQPEKIANTEQLLGYFEQCLAAGKAGLVAASDADLQPNWTLRSGKTVLSATTKSEFVRIIFSQVIHHRAQMGVYLRLLNIPIPGSYGPSADEMNF